MMKAQRYFMSMHPENGVDPHPHDKGEWVKYEDYIFMLKYKNLRIEHLERRIEELKKGNHENMG